MKKLLFLAFCIAGIITGCQNRDDNKINPGNANSPFPQSGEWVLTYYSDNGDVKTADYLVYDFDFKPANVVTATINDKTLNGSWSLSAVDNNKRKLHLGFNNGDQTLAALNDHWLVISVTETEIKLMDDDENSAKFLDFNRR